MRLFTKKYEVKANTTGYLYRNNIYEKKLTAGYYKIRDWKNRTSLICLPTTSKLLTIINQEVLTKDNVAFRFSFNILYKIVDGEKFLSQFPLNAKVSYIIEQAEQRLYNMVQIMIRNRISQYESETLNEKRHELTDLKTDEIINQALAFGIEIEEVQLKDLTFPRAIQSLFSKHLEAKVRAKSELENSRTAVATARALKNASELMKNDENIKFFKLLETITKIAQKGKHTFNFGDLNQLTK